MTEESTELKQPRLLDHPVEPTLVTVSFTGLLALCLGVAAMMMDFALLKGAEWMVVLLGSVMLAVSSYGIRQIHPKPKK